MRTTGTLVLIALALGVLQASIEWPLFASAPVTVAVSIALAVITSGTTAALAVMLGSAGALIHASLLPGLPCTGMALLLAAAYGARAVRGRHPAAGAAVVASAMICGAGAAYLSSRYGQAGVVGAVALGVGAILVAAPMLIPVDDPRTARLRANASLRTGPARWSLLRAVVLRRRMAPRMEELPRSDVRRIERAWATVERLARARPPRRVPELDRRIAEHVAALGRLERSLDARDALEEGLDLEVLAELERRHEELETEAAAYSEVGLRA